jgi:hypothetical protein
VGANKWEGEDEDEDVKVRGSKMIYSRLFNLLATNTMKKYNCVNVYVKVIDIGEAYFS